MIGLFESQIFNHVLDYAEWPGTHYNTTKMIAPFNGSSLKLRFEYGSIFKSLHQHDEANRKHEEEHNKPGKKEGFLK
jgi:hypothetical protein